MSKIKVKLKKGVGKHLRLTDPGFSLTISGDEAVELEEHEYNRVRSFVDKVKSKPKPKPKSEEEIITLNEE